MQGEIEFAGLLALSFVRFHRFTAVSYKLPLLELLAGAAYAVAEANGISRAGHVRDKLTHLAAYHTTVRGLIEHAAHTCTIEDGVAVPNTLLTNVAKYHFAHNYHQAVQIVQDIAGGLLVTGPAAEDLSSEATRAYVLKYMGGAKGFDAEDRLRLLNLIGDLQRRISVATRKCSRCTPKADSKPRSCRLIASTTSRRWPPTRASSRRAEPCTQY